MDIRILSEYITRIHFVHFSESAEFSDNFDSNIGTQRFVIMEKFTFEVDDLRKRR